MSLGLQSALIEAAKEAGAYCAPLVDERTTFTLKRLPTEFGLPVIHPERHAWRQSFDAAIRRICEDGLPVKDVRGHPGPGERAAFP
jgi:hypothetical protein